MEAGIPEERQLSLARTRGHSLVELVLVVALLGICIAWGARSLSVGMRNQEARGAAQSWQAAAAWAQVGVLWHGGSSRLSYAPGRLSVSHDLSLCSAGALTSIPFAPATTNLARWRSGAGVVTKFGGPFASPDGGGSLFFAAGKGSYRVVVRPESGLTVRVREDAGR